jgi:Ca-activated chloride channel homolog
MSWSDLWWRKDQQGMRLLAKGKNEQAAHTFESSSWKAVANYRAYKYQKVEQELKNMQDPVSQYNLGNALALQGKYAAAINAYSQAIKTQPNFNDAIYNRDLIQKLLRKNVQQQKQPQNTSKGAKQQQQPEQNQDQSKQDKSQQPQSKSQTNQDNQNNQDNNENKENNENTQNNPDEQQHDKNQQQPSSSERQNNSVQQQKQGANQDSQSKEKSQDSNGEDQGMSNAEREQIKHEAGNHQQQAINTGQQGTGDKKLDQETDQWLQQITDDPGDLLRRKIMRDHLRKIHQL